MLCISRICVCVLLLWGGAEVAVAQDNDPLIGKKAGDSRAITIPDGGGELAMSWCPPGTFTMGSPASETGRSEDEDDTAGEGGQPVEVTLTKGFWMFQMETTQRQWTAVMGTTPWVNTGITDFYKASENNPAVFMDYTAAEAYCAKLTEMERQAGRLPTGWTYALPTEAQWEYACRAGTTTQYSFGDDAAQLGEHAWFDANADKVGEKYAHAVGNYRPNPWGLSDMHGNVWEWCRDGYRGKMPGGTDPFVMPFVTDSGVSHRAFRCGSWSSSSQDCRSARRYGHMPTFRWDHLGFRVALVSDFSDIYEQVTAANVVGRYELDTPQNDWNKGEIRAVTDKEGQAALEWVNAAGVTWGLTLQPHGVLATDDRNPYLKSHPALKPSFQLELMRGPDGIPGPPGGFSFIGSFYRRIRNAP